MTQHLRFSVTIALIVALGGFLMGFDASVISGVVGFIETEFELTKLELGWTVSSLAFTATLAMMVAGPISDRVGRRAVLTVAAILVGAQPEPALVFESPHRPVDGLSDSRCLFRHRSPIPSLGDLPAACSRDAAQLPAAPRG